MDSIAKILTLLENDIINSKEARKLIKVIKEERITNIGDERIDRILGENRFFCKLKKGISILIQSLKKVLYIIVICLMKVLDFIYKCLSIILKYLLFILASKETLKITDKRGININYIADTGIEPIILNTSLVEYQNEKLDELNN